MPLNCGGCYKLTGCNWCSPDICTFSTSPGEGVYDITTGSLVSFPHPYRLVEIRLDRETGIHVHIQSYRVGSLPGWPDLQAFSREWMGQRSEPVVVKFLTSAPLHLPLEQAQALAPQLRHFWAGVAAGDPDLAFPDFPQPAGRFLERFSRCFRCPPDNQAQLHLLPRGFSIS